MFSFLSGVVLRRPWAVVLAWLALTSALFVFGPRWEDVTKDDDVRFFPPGSTSVIGQELLERGFPRDASSSQLVLVYERKDQAVTQDDLRHADDVASKLFQFAQANPTLGIEKRPDSPATPLIGPRLIGRDAQGTEARRARDCEVSGNLPFQEDANRRRSNPEVAEERGAAGSPPGSSTAGPARPPSAATPTSPPPRASTTRPTARSAWSC